MGGPSTRGTVVAVWAVHLASLVLRRTRMNQPTSDQTPKPRSVSRRLLVKAGWVVPVVLAVGIPRSAFAGYGNGLPDMCDGKPCDDNGLPE
jgi:hypothetical protein